MPERYRLLAAPRLALLSLVFASSCLRQGASIATPTPSPTLEPRIVEELESNRRKEEILGLDDLDRFGARFSIQSLRKTKLEDNDRELRVWVGFAPHVTRGLIISNDRATLLHPLGEPEQVRKPQPVSPRSGWDRAWSLIEETGILKLREEKAMEAVEPFHDSTAVIVEMRTGNDYRYILYHAPCRSPRPESKQLVDAIATIGHEFSISFYDCGNG